FGHAARSRPEERVDDDVSSREQVGGGAVDAEGPRPDPRTPELPELAPCVAAHFVRRRDEQDRRPGTVTLEPAGHDEAVAAVAPFAADDDDSRAAARRAERRQPADDRLGRTAAGVLHQRGSGDAELGDRPLIEPPHLLGGEDAQHSYLATGSGIAWVRKSARMAT